MAAVLFLRLFPFPSLFLDSGTSTEPEVDSGTGSGAGPEILRITGYNEMLSGPSAIPALFSSMVSIGTLNHPTSSVEIKSCLRSSPIVVHKKNNNN